MLNGIEIKDLVYDLKCCAFAKMPWIEFFLFCECSAEMCREVPTPVQIVLIWKLSPTVNTRGAL